MPCINFCYLLYRFTLIHGSKKCYICTKFIDVAVGIVSKWYKQYFLHPVYVIAMYLSPNYCNLAISKIFSHNYLKSEIVKLAMNWKLKKDKCIQVAQDIHKYNSFIFTKDHKTMTPKYFWKTTQQFAEPMRKLASFMFQVKGHAALGSLCSHHYHNQNPKSRTR